MRYRTSATGWNHGIHGRREGIQGRREGCAEGKAASGSGLEGAPIESQKEVQNYCFME